MGNIDKHAATSQISFDEDPPPPYQDSQSFHAPADELESSPVDDSNQPCCRGLFSRYSSLFPTSSTTSRDLEPKFWRPKEQLRILSPDPKDIMCRCGRHVDTTIHYKSLDPSSIRCTCGYIVTSNGYSYLPPTAAKSQAAKIEFSCGGRSNGAAFACSCGATFSPEGSPKQFCEQHSSWSGDERSVRCDCGRYVDITALWTSEHGRASEKRSFSRDPALVGYTMYTYKLPAGSGRCDCGLTVRRDGTVTSRHSNTCCKVTSKKAVSKGGNGCTCT